MLIRKIFNLILFTLSLNQFVTGKDEKSSLIFVIDNTWSMKDDIEQVIIATERIFDTVMNEPKSQIHNFILVQFIDPDNGPIVEVGPTWPHCCAQVKANTTRRSEFKKALKYNPVGDYTCEEYAMAGIYLGIDAGLERSNIYVFTDASAKDYKKYEEVNNLAKEKQMQIDFVLTGECDGDHNTERYQVFQHLADNNNGIIFHLHKQDINQFLNYVTNVIRGRPYEIINTKFPPGSHNVHYTVDPMMEREMIAACGEDVTAKVTSADGSQLDTSTLYANNKNMILQVNSGPGYRKVNVKSKSDSCLKVTAASAVHFRHAFSPNPCTQTFADIANNVVPDKHSQHLCIELTEGDINVQKIILVDLNGTVIYELPVKESNKGGNVYEANTGKIPDQVFRIGIVGVEPTKNITIQRINTFTVECSLPIEVDIIGGPILEVNSNKPLQLECIFSGYPTPKVIWKDVNNGVDLHSTVELNKPPFEYKSVINITNVKYNSKYKCIATNSLKSKSSTLKITTQPHINVLIKTENLNIEYLKSGQIICKTESYPKAITEWYYNSTKLVPTDDIEISPNKSMVTIKSMRIDYNGIYTCEVKNGHQTVSLDSVLSVSGLVAASIDTPSKLNVTKVINSTLDLECIAHGIPPPEVKWTYRKFDSNSPVPLNEPFNSSHIHKNLTQVDEDGYYVCEASNGYGPPAQVQYEVHVFESPNIDKSSPDTITANINSDVELNCKILRGKPKPSIRWEVQIQSSSAKPINEWDDLESPVIKNVQKYNNGTYKCIASNGVDPEDIFEIELEVEYPPTISVSSHIVQAEAGKDLFLVCQTDGRPTPRVTWLKNNKTISNAVKPGLWISSNTNFDDSGNYTCTAKNKFNSTSETINVEVYIPVSIDTPSELNKTLLVGSVLDLECIAHGYPTPEIRWTYRKFDSITPLNLSEAFNSSHIHKDLTQADENGYYVCVASNGYGSPAQVQYEVHVFAGATIKNKYKETVFKPVKGDLVLSIECNALGEPKPTVTWFVNGEIIVTDDSYNIVNNTLYLNNIDTNLDGSYTCEAQNDFNKASVTYEVEVQDEPSPSLPSKTFYIEEGNSTSIKCPVAHNDTDIIRWYKDGKLDLEGELTLADVTSEDAGDYTCRVSNSNVSRSSTIRVIVGFKPRFISEEEEHIEFSRGIEITLVCEAEGDPNPSVLWWFNDKPLNEYEMNYQLEMDYGDEGLYKCEVTNDIGSISRTFNVTNSQDCIINWEKEINRENQPMMINERNWPKYIIKNRTMYIPNNEYIYTFCPNEFQGLLNNDQLMLICQNSEFLANGDKINYKDLICDQNYKHVVKNTNTECYGENTKKIIIGYKLFMFVEVYEICYNVVNNMAVYTKQLMPKSLTDINAVSLWTDKDKTAYNFDELYDSEMQVNKDDKCKFMKRQLVNPKDVFPGTPQSSTYSYLNVVPHWGTCNFENWNEIEQRVRNLTMEAFDNLIVWTGVSGQLELKDFNGNDMKNQRQIIPKYLWKVVQDRATQSSLAIIQTNIPNLKQSDIPIHTLCKDICNDTEWMKSSRWANPDAGYTYCCSLEDFEKAFRFKIIFYRYPAKLHHTSLFNERSSI